MTPTAQAFTDRFGSCADQVATGTGISRLALLVQWAVETALGAQVFGNNPGNIECGPGVFCQYPSLDAFAMAAIHVWRQTAYINSEYPNGFEPYRAACVGKSIRVQLLSIGASPWDAGKYGLAECGYSGCSLVTMWQTEFGGLDVPQPYLQNNGGTVIMAADSLNLYVAGVPPDVTKPISFDNPGQGLWHRRGVRDATGVFTYGAWENLGGKLGTDHLAAGLENGVIHIYVDGINADELYETVSSDDGLTHTALADLGGKGTGLIVVGSVPASGGAPTERHVSGTFLGDITG